MSGAADGHAGSTPPGPAGFLQEESRDRERIFTQLGEARRTIHGQNPQHQGPPTIQVSEVTIVCVCVCVCDREKQSVTTHE